MIDPRIALSGQQPNIVNALAQGTQAAGQVAALQRQAEGQNIFRQHGAGILAGEQGAMNALAQYDPQAALGVKQTHQGMAVQQEKLEMARQQARMAAEAQAAQISAAEAQREAAGIERAVAAAMAAKSQEELDAFLGTTAPELVGQITLENRELYAAQALGVKDALEMSKGPEPSKPGNDYERYAARERAAGREPMDEFAYRREVEATKPGKRTVVRDPSTGEIVYEEGPAGASTPKLTVEAGKNTGYYLRTLDAHETLNELEAQGLDFVQQNVDVAPLGIGNYARTPEFQKFDQARRDFVNAILRRESGAVISDAEFDNANKQYFPQPGDSQEVIEQKRRNRANAIEGLRIGSAEGGEYVDKRREAQEPQTFEQFSAEPTAQAAAAKYGVTLEEMWAIKQGQ